MAYNPYYIQPQYPQYNQGYYNTQQINNFRQAMPNQNSFSAQGSFSQQQAPQATSQVNGANMMAGAGSVIQGAGQIVGHIADGNAQARSINTGLSAQEEYDPYGQPVYNLGADQQRYLQTDTSKVGKGMVGKTALAGAQAGSAFGPIGTVVGGFVGAVAGAFGRNSVRQKAKKRKRKLASNLQAAQSRFNDQNIMSGQNQLAQSAYMDQIRTNNPYAFPTNYY